MRVPAWGWLAGIMVLSAWVRLYGLDALSLWNDELFSRYYPRVGQAFLWGPGRGLEPTPPLYYSLLGWWMGFVGESAWGVRLFSVMASLAGVPVVYGLGRRLFGERAGLLGALCFGLQPTNVFYAQEARSYALEGTAVGLAMLGMAVFLEGPERWRGLGIYVLGAVGAVWCHLTAGLFVVAANLAVLGGLRGTLSGRAFLRWCGANLVVGLGCLPLVTVVLSPAVGGAVGWMEPVDAGTVVYAFATVVAGPAVFDVAGPVAVFCLLVMGVLVGVPRWRPGREAMIVVVGVPVVFFGLIVLVSLRQPMLMLRTVAWLSVPMSVVLGGVLARRSWGWPVLVVGLLCGGLGVQVVRGAVLKEDWRGFLQGLAPRLEAAGSVVLAPSMPATALDFYAPGVRPLLQLPGVGAGTVESTVIPRLVGVVPFGWDAFGTAISRGQPVWLLVKGVEDAALRERLARLPAARERVEGGPGVALRW